MLQFRIALIAVLATGLSAACGGGTTTAPAEQTTPAVTDSFGLPSPTEIAHGTSAADESVTGAGFISGARSLVEADGNQGVFSPDWPVSATGSGNRDLAWAAYGFAVADATGYTGLDLSWANAPESWWLGLGNYDTSGWEWYAGSGSLNLPASLLPYLDAGTMLVVVAAIGETEGRLDTVTLAGNSGGGGLTNMFFLHHSVGDGVVMQGDVRGHIDDYNSAHGTSYEFWDHGYYEWGLRDPDGNKDDTDYGPMTDMTDPPDLHDLWTSDDPDWAALRTTILNNHEIIAFKSCYPASGIPDEDELEWRKTMYRNMRAFFDTRTDKLFVVMSTPPLNPDETNLGDASRARAFADWLKSSEYLAGHPNVVCFDLFDVLAEPDDGSADANMLRSAYRDGSDSHPNTAGYVAGGAAFAQFLCEAAEAY